jgi:putative ABC transport system substrate-binding protein
VISRASNDAELDAAFALLVRQGVGSLLVAADPYFDMQRALIIEFALQNRLPAIYQFREYVTAGGLLSYGVDLTEAYRQFGVYAAKILKGAKPTDLPVQQVVKFELVINLKAAKAIGFEFPPTLLARADEVIE